MKKFETLLLEGIDEEITGTKIEKLVQVKAIFEAEMLNPNVSPCPESIKSWLLGLPSAIHIPWENHEILEWYRKAVKNGPRTQFTGRMKDDTHVWVDRYWNQAALTLYYLLYD